MSQVFESRIEALVQRDGRKKVAEYYSVSTSTIDRWRKGGNPRNSSTRSSVMNRGKRITGKAVSIRDKAGKLSFEQFSKEETNQIVETFGSASLDKRERGLLEKISIKQEKRLRKALKSARTASDKIIARNRLDDFLESKDEILRDIVELYQKAKATNDKNDWEDFRQAYKNILTR